MGMKRPRQRLLARVVLAGSALGCALVLAQGAAAAGVPSYGDARTARNIAGDGGVISRMTNSGKDAPGLRFGLLGLLGLALGYGAFVQYQSSANAPLPPPRKRSRRTGPAQVPPAPPVVAESAPEAPARPDTSPRATPLPSVMQPTDWQSTGPQPIRLEPYLRERQTPPPKVARPAPLLTPAEEDCARAIMAAHRYDRRGTLTAFSRALDNDPAAKPSALPGFWEMPASGHADLARAYLRRGQRLDARTVLSLALLTFPHNRELAALMQETDGYRGEETA